MKIESLFGISEKGIFEKKHNIIIPICLGNKFFSENFIPTNNLKEYIKFALENTKDKVLILIVDKIQDTNIFVRMTNKTEIGATTLAIKQGVKIKENLIKMLQKEFSSFNNIEVINYLDYENNNPNSLKITHLVYKFFKNNKDFQKEILDSVKNSVKDRRFTKEQYLKLCDYVLDEFALCFNSLNFNTINYDLFLYPDVDEVLILIENIKSNKKFLKLKNQIDLIDKSRMRWCILR